MRIDELSFYCVNCGKTYKAENIELSKLEVGGNLKTIFECPDCCENDFQIYSNRFN